MTNSHNPGTGAECERLVQAFFAKQGLSPVPSVSIPVGVRAAKKMHKFDRSCETPPVLVECKCHVWIDGGDAPSAKLTVGNEPMLYFIGAPAKYRELLVVQRSLRGERQARASGRK